MSENITQARDRYIQQREQALARQHELEKELVRVQQLTIALSGAIEALDALLQEGRVQQENRTDKTS
jgi:hypothetical protein